MRKLTALLALIQAVGFAWAIPGSAQLLPNCLPGQSGTAPPQSQPDSAVCQGATIVEPANGPHGVSGTSYSSTSTNITRNSSGPTIRYIPYDRVTTGPDGRPCITTGYYAAGTQPNDSEALDPGTQNVLDIHGLPPLEYPPCPARPQLPGEPAPAETPSMIARRYWEQVTLPRPQPTIAPGRAITGKSAYLETRGQTSRTYTNDTIFGPLHIYASGSYTVAWGDGSTSGPHAYEGGPWPSGRIMHDYVDVGSYDIVVTQKWTATWSLGGQSGVLRTLQTTGRLDDFPVQQIQAVVG